MNGVMSRGGMGNSGHRHPPSQEEHKYKSFKLIADPLLGRGKQKVIRYDGIIPGKVNQPLVDVRDPRSRLTRLWKDTEPADLPVPKMKIDANYVGPPPPRELTFANLNDNIREAFLDDMCRKFGTVEERQIFYHPKNAQAHGHRQGALRVDDVGPGVHREAATTRRVMGKVMSVFVDNHGCTNTRCHHTLPSHNVRDVEMHISLKSDVFGATCSFLVDACIN
ncbi:PREDICTED: histone-lysine N-methyltransferase SETD1B-like [Priapulus caudatus]|uniref:Histone-lysine N-methyltransferase SETD1B-like n=1 Tax=Priapulus caudatus TaxID=37621 RepID=A0ABM1EHC8_PRICU|nr:PREDICTED: histone-lysine N-methyltransferase SETD1B-like [Priapulus caudatus]